MPSISAKALEAATVAPPVEAEAPEFVWIDIPQRDLTDYPFHGIDINLQHYGSSYGPFRCHCMASPGCNDTGVHKVTPEAAREIRERLKVAREQEVKLFSSKVNLKALAQVIGGSAMGGNYAAAHGEFVKEKI